MDLNSFKTELDKVEAATIKQFVEIQKAVAITVYKMVATDSRQAHPYGVDIIAQTITSLLENQMLV